MGKVLIATFRDDEEINELILFLKKKGNVEILDDIPTDNVLTYDGLEIDPKYKQSPAEAQEDRQEDFCARPPAFDAGRDSKTEWESGTTDGSNGRDGAQTEIAKGGGYTLFRCVSSDFVMFETGNCRKLFCQHFSDSGIV